MNGSAAALVLAACAAAIGVIVLAASCIPDLPADRQVDAQSSAATCGDGVIDLDAGEQCDPGSGAGDAAGSVCSAGCEIVCEGGLLWARNLHCYQVVAPGALALQAASGSANALCQQANGHVVTFASEDEYRAVAGALDAGLFWVGLSRDPASPASNAYTPVAQSLLEPGWSTACPGCYAHTSDASAPLPVYPGAGADGGSTSCVVASSDVTQPWREYPCTIPLAARRPVLPVPKVVCEREPLGQLSEPCEAGRCFDLVATNGRKNYVYESAAVTPDEARQGCLAVGGRLVVLESPEEREQLWRELSHQDVVPYAVWIGLSEAANTLASLRRGSGAAGWQWDDGQPADAYPSEWGNSQPRLVGALASRAFLWQQPNEDDTLAHNDQVTFSTLPYVCETGP